MKDFLRFIVSLSMNIKQKKGFTLEWVTLASYLIGGIILYLNLKNDIEKVSANYLEDSVFHMFKN